MLVVNHLDGDFPGGEVYRRWSPRPWPEWITFVPSRASTMPADLATALGAVLGLPVHDVVERVADRPPQATMDNSAQQLANVHDAFEVADEVPPAPVLVALHPAYLTLRELAELPRHPGQQRLEL